MRSTGYNQLHLVLLAVKDWGRGIPSKKPLEKTLVQSHKEVDGGTERRYNTIHTKSSEKLRPHNYSQVLMYQTQQLDYIECVKDSH